MDRWLQDGWVVLNVHACEVFWHEIGACCQGHNKPITVLSLSPDRKKIYTGSHDGFITHWDANTGECEKWVLMQYTYPQVLTWHFGHFSLSCVQALNVYRALNSHSTNITYVMVCLIWGMLTFNPLPVQFKALLHGQKGRVFFSGHLNLRTTPETGLPSREKNHNN